MKYIFFIFIFIGASTTGFTQTDAIQRLESKLFNNPTDEEKIEIYNELAKHYINIDIRVTDSLAQIALETAQKRGDKNGQGTALLRKAQVKHAIPDVAKSLAIAKQAEAYFQAMDNQLGIFQAQSHQTSEYLAVALIAKIDINITQFVNRYISISAQHIKLANEGKVQLDREQLYKNYKNISVSYYFLGNDDKEEEYRIKCEQYSEHKGRHLDGLFDLQKGAVHYSNYRLTQRSIQLNLAKKFYEKAIKIFKEEKLEEKLFIARADLASIYFYKGNYEEAKKRAIYLRDSSEHVQNRFKKGILLQNIGSYYLQFGDIEEGKRLTEEAAKYANLNPQIYINLAFVYLSLKDFEQSHNYLFEKIDTSEIDNESSNYAFLLYGKGLYWQYQEKFDASIYYLEKAAGIFDTLSLDWLTQVYYQLGVSYTKNNQLRKGEQLFLETLSKLERKKDTPQRDFILFQNALGELYATFPIPKKRNALIAYQKALNYSLKTPQDKDKIDISYTPQLTDIKLNNYALAPIISKGQLLIQQFEKNQDIKELELAISTLELGVQLIDTLRYDFSGSYSGIQKMDDDFFLVFDELIKAYVLMAKVSTQKTHDAQNIQDKSIWYSKAFEVSEKSRYYLLWHSVAKRNIINYTANLEDDLIKNLYALNSFINKKYANLDILFSERQKQKNKNYNDLIKKNSWILDYLPRDTSTINIKTTQSLLDENQAMIKYHVADDKLYTFVISKNEFYPLLETSLPKIRATAHRLEQLIKRQRFYDTDSISKKIAREEEREFAQKSHQLYQMILEQPLQELPSSVKRLIIVPADSLQHISFDFLLTQPFESDENIEFKWLDFLIKEYAVSVVSSAKVLSELDAIKDNLSNQVGIFAPSYIETNNQKVNKENKAKGINKTKGVKSCVELFENGIDSLDYKEPEAIKEVFPSPSVVYWKGNSATKTKFKTYCETEDLALLYCSMHGCVDNSPSSSRLLFADVRNYDDTSRTLRLSEIHQLDINAKLVVLSACETGIGVDDSKSEGFSSIAKAFQAAGCPSVVMSRWSVPQDEMTTQKIMEIFSENLKNGDNVDIALQKAKKTFLKQSNLDAACKPFYWSVSVILGHSKPIFSQ